MVHASHMREVWRGASHGAGDVMPRRTAGLHEGNVLRWANGTRPQLVCRQLHFGGFNCV